MKNRYTLVRTTFSIILVFTSNYAISQSLNIDKIFKLVNGSPSEITSELIIKDWTFVSADKDMSDDNTLMMEERIIFHYKDKYSNYVTASLVHVKIFNFEPGLFFDTKTETYKTKIGYYLKLYYKFTNSQEFSDLNKQMIVKGLKIEQDEVLEDGRIVKAFNHEDYNIEMEVIPSDDGHYFALLVESKYLVE